jgi:hypothetical protein
MLIRILPVAVFGLTVFVGCNRSVESKLVGTWRVTGRDDAGQVDYRKDHAVTSREWAVTYAHQPPVLFDTGVWHMRGNKLIMDFRTDNHPSEAKHAEFSLAMFDDDHFAIRRLSGIVITLERQK